MSRMLARSWLFRSPVPRTGTTLVLCAARQRHPRLYSAQHPSQAVFTSAPPLRRYHGTTQQVEEAAAESTAPAGSDTLASALISTSSVLSAVREYRQKYPGCVLLVRVGDFYELYFDHADDIGGDLLGLQVVNKKFRNGTVRFTGFPARSLDRYLETLVARHGLNVALCEQFQEPMRRVFTRKVTRVITPGTLIDEQYANSTRMHNYIVSIARIDPRSIEHQQMVNRWQRDKAAIEERHAADVSRIIAEAKRKWEMEREGLEARQKRRGPGRPRKHQGTIPIDFLLAEEFDPSSVCVPDPPEIPPRPDFSINASSDPSTIDASLSLAWLDLATGDFMTCSSSPSSLPTDLARIRPREILVDESDYMVHDMVKAIYPCSSTSSQITGQPAVTHVTAASFHQWSQPQVPGTECEPNSSITDEPEEKRSNSLNPNVHWQLSAPSQSLVTTPDMLLLEATELSSCEQTAARALLNYVLDTQLGLLPPLQPPKRYQVEGHMKMSAATIQALELIRPQLSGDRGSSEHTLLAEIDYTKTSSGARLLAKRLTAPSTSIDIIEQRMDLLEFFRVNSRARELVREHLEGISDIERAVNKLSLNCGGPHDLLDIARTLQEVTKIKQVLEAALVPKKQPADVRRIFSQRKRAAPSYRSPEAIIEVARRKATALQTLMPLVRNIESKIRVDAERDIRVFGFLKPNCSTHLTHLHEKLKEKNRERHQMQEKWISRYHCPSLKLETLSNIGHFIEVSKRDASTLLDSSGFRMIQTLKSKVRFENPEWT
ncbi:MutS protein 1, partial [Linderina pennispora]